MPKYQVTVKSNEEYLVEVTSDDESEAIEDALELMGENGWSEYLISIDENTTVVETEEDWT